MDVGPVVLVTDRGLASGPLVAQVRDLLVAAGRSIEVYSDIDPNPDEPMVERLTFRLRSLMSEHREHTVQVVVLGGGSAMDTAKAAVCMAPNEGPMSDYQWEGRKFEKAPLPLFAVPTTAGTGSEVTGVTVIASRSTKKGIKQDAVFPVCAVLDPQLMVTLPPSLTASTGMDALTHGIEAYVGRNRNPLVRSLAASAVSLVSRNLIRAYQDGSDLEAREAMAHGSLLAGLAMDQGGLGIVHSLSSALCGILHVAHGEGNALLLPYGMRYNLPYATADLSDLAWLMGMDTRDTNQEEAARRAISFVEDLQTRLGMGPQIDDIRAKLKAQTDLSLFGSIAAGMFLMKNNPHPANAEECCRIFLEIRDR
jgi:alcohol dehydrogenase class IV